MAEQKYYTISSIEKAFSVIELMTHKALWDLRELAKISGLPKGTLQRILLTLEELGYVRQEHRGGAYGLTLKLFQTGRRVVSNNNLVELARPHCRALLEAVNETVNLCMASGEEMVVVDQQVSRHHLRLDSIVGSSFPVYPSASGKIWLAFQEERESLRLLQALNKNSAMPPDAVNDFIAELTVVRREGVAFDYEEIFEGVRCVAAPIFDYSGNIVATLGCSVPTIRLSEELSARLVREISQKAQTISGLLGAPARPFQPVGRSMLDVAASLPGPQGSEACGRLGG